MYKNTELTKHLVINFLDTLRKPNGDRHNPPNPQTFYTVATSAWKNLQLKGAVNPLGLERLLINLIEEIYNKESSDKNVVRCRDISLLMFGLLDGYYHTDPKTGKDIDPRTRYAKYLRNSDFISIAYPGESSYEDFEKNAEPGKQSKPLNLLTSIAGNCKKEIAKVLLDKIRSGDYEQYMGMSEDGETPLILPKPCYVAERFLSTKNGSIEAEGENDSHLIIAEIKSEIFSSIRRQKVTHRKLIKKLKEKRENILAVSLSILLGVAVAFLVIVPHRNSEAHERSAENKAYNIYLNVGINNIYNGKSSMDGEAEDSKNANTIVDAPIDYR